MIVIREPVAITTIRAEHNHFFEGMIKIVVDIEKNLLAADAEMHADLEQHLLEKGSSQQNLWGANVYFEGPVFIEFTSLINIRPGQKNRGMEVEDLMIRSQMETIVNNLIVK